MRAAIAILALALVAGCSTPDIDWPWEPDGDTNTVTTTTTAVEPEPSGDYTITQVWAGGIKWSGPDFPASWGAAPPATCGEFHVYRANGKGGKLDHIRRNTRQRDWKNMPSYGVWQSVGEPAKGETCTVRVCNYDHDEWVEIGAFQWPR